MLRNIVAVLCLALPLASGPAPPQDLTPSSVDAFVTGYREATGLPGVAVAITKGGRVVHAAGTAGPPPASR
ncbi:hypothetical protein [Nonomuraea sp. NPDC005692]|uniref:hypothetical protein n=1 Tax=Nonomuraea sp. NPDC005692 TaxID=3157168 RepID=UPI0033F69B7E